jgi:hypothetical protein
LPHTTREQTEDQRLEDYELRLAPERGILRVLVEQQRRHAHHLTQEALEPLRVVARTALGEHRHLGPCILERDPVVEPSEDHHLWATADGEVRRMGPQRKPDLVGRRELEVRGHDADDSVRRAPNADRLPDDAGVAGEPGAPQALSEEGHGRGAVQLVGGVEHAAEEGPGP